MQIIAKPHSTQKYTTPTCNHNYKLETITKFVI